MNLATWLHGIGCSHFDGVWIRQGRAIHSRWFHGSLVHEDPLIPYHVLDSNCRSYRWLPSRTLSFQWKFRFFHPSHSYESLDIDEVNVIAFPTYVLSGGWALSFPFPLFANPLLQMRLNLFRRFIKQVDIVFPWLSSSSPCQTFNQCLDLPPSNHFPLLKCVGPE